MFDRKINLYAGVFMVVVAALFVLSMTGSAGAFPFVLQGKVVTIDSGSHKLTLQEDQCGMSGQYGIAWDDSTTVMRGSDFVSLNDLRVGDEISITYYESSPGLYIAEDINILPAGVRENC
jgi:hypothetical protein